MKSWIYVDPKTDVKVYVYACTVNFRFTFKLYTNNKTNNHQ